MRGAELIAEEVVTISRIVHGGAVSSLIDVAAVATGLVTYKLG